MRGRRGLESSAAVGVGDAASRRVGLDLGKKGNGRLREVASPHLDSGGGRRLGRWLSSARSRRSMEGETRACRAPGDRSWIPVVQRPTTEPEFRQWRKNSSVPRSRGPARIEGRAVVLLPAEQASYLTG